MGRWSPKDDQPVGPNEHIGRRLFDEPKLFGATDQNPLEGLSIRNFSPGKDREFSVDRVGDGCFHTQAMRYLEPRALDQATTFKNPSRFDGWLTVPARKLASPQHGRAWALIPSPERGPLIDGQPADWAESNVKQNRCHAHVSVPNDMEDDYFAWIVRAIFVSNNKHYPPSALIGQTAACVPENLTKLQQWARSQDWLRKIRNIVWGD
jgi:hypothetical protein